MTDHWTIELEGMEFHSFHGCLPEERRDGNSFLVNFSASLADIPEGAFTDDLSGTADYGKIYDTVARCMENPSNLLENVVQRIIEAVSEAFPDSFESFSVEVAKSAPPVGGPVAWSKVSARWKR